MEETPASLDQRLLEKAESWLEDSGSVLAQTPMMRRRDDRYRSSHALSTALETEFWADDLLVQKLALPWLQLHGSECRLARFLLVKVLKTGCEPEAVIEKALEWFESYMHLSEAPYVLDAVAKRLDGRCEQSKRAANLGIQWLDYHFKTENKDIWNGQFIISSVLQWDEKRRVDDLVGWTLRWLDKFGQYRRASYVIRTVLKKTPPKGDRLTEVTRHALDWFEPETRETNIEAHPVINALLENGGLEDHALKKEAASYAASWLSAHGRSFEARYVLQPTLLWIAESGSSTSLFDEFDPVKKTLQWLENEEYLHAERSELVVGALLRATGTDDDEDTFEVVLEHALRWIEQHKDEERGQRVINEVLRHPDVGHDTKTEVAESALEWLTAHSSSPKRDFVINSLLMNWESLSSSDDRQAVIESAFGVSHDVMQNDREASFDREEAKEVLLRVLSLPGTSRAEEAKRLIRGLGYDVHSTRFKSRSTIIQNTLERTDPGDAERTKFIKEGADLLCNPKTHRRCEKWTYFLEDIFECSDLKPRDRNRVADAVSEWVCNTNAGQNDDWFFAYEEVLEARPDFPQESTLVRIGFDWINSQDDLYYEHFQHESWRHMYESMLKHPALDQQWRERLVRVGKIWLDGDGEEQDDHWDRIYTAMLEYGELDDTNAKELIEMGTDWLMQNPAHEKRQKVYESAKEDARQLETEQDKYLRMLSNAARLWH
jgi:hypothetical protein